MSWSRRVPEQVKHSISGPHIFLFNLFYYVLVRLKSELMRQHGVTVMREISLNFYELVIDTSD